MPWQMALLRHLPDCIRRVEASSTRRTSEWAGGESVCPFWLGERESSRSHPLVRVLEDELHRELNVARQVGVPDLSEMVVLADAGSAVISLRAITEVHIWLIEVRVIESVERL
jgi:hypothetical protein